MLASIRSSASASRPTSVFPGEPVTISGQLTSSGFNRINSDAGTLTLVGPEGTDVVTGVEQLQFANGTFSVADINHAPVANDDTKVQTGHGTLAKKSDVAEYNTMLKTARERVEKLVKEGKSEAEVIALRPLKDLDEKWAADDAAAIAYLKMVYNSFKRS